MLSCMCIIREIQLNNRRSRFLGMSHSCCMKRPVFLFTRFLTTYKTRACRKLALIDFTDCSRGMQHKNNRCFYSSLLNLLSCFPKDFHSTIFCGLIPYKCADKMAFFFIFFSNVILIKFNKLLKNARLTFFEVKKKDFFLLLYFKIFFTRYDVSQKEM